MEELYSCKVYIQQMKQNMVFEYLNVYTHLINLRVFTKKPRIHK